MTKDQQGAQGGRSTGMSLSSHRALEFGLGLAVFGTFLVLGMTEAGDLGGGATLIGIVLGLALASAGVAADRSGRDPAGASHQAVDRILIVLLLAAAIGLAFAGEALGAWLLVGAAGLEMLITAMTRSHAVRPRSSGDPARNARG